MSISREGLLEIQAEQLADWKILLKPEVYKELEKLILASNDRFEAKANPWKILRGTEIEMILVNQVRNKFRKLAEEKDDSGEIRYEEGMMVEFTDVSETSGCLFHNTGVIEEVTQTTLTIKGREGTFKYPITLNLSVVKR